MSIIFWGSFIGILFFAGWEFLRSFYAHASREAPDWSWKLLAIRGLLITLLALALIVPHKAAISRYEALSVEATTTQATLSLKLAEARREKVSLQQKQADKVKRATERVVREELKAQDDQDMDEARKRILNQ